MTFYEQIQASIDFAEQNLTENISFEKAAKISFMSVSNFYRYFTALTGYSFKEYLRKRRLTESLKDLLSKRKIVEIAFNYCFENHESYSRAFRKEFQLSPSEYRKNKPLLYGLKSIKLAEETFMGLLIKNLPTMEVAFYRVISKTPETDAWTHIKKWADVNKISDSPYRIFGYNNPSPDQMKTIKNSNGEEILVHTDNSEYGYEFMIATNLTIIPEKSGRGVDKKTVPGGRYAVLSIGVGCEEIDIGKGWARMMHLLKEGKYETTGRWFEEHIDFNPEVNTNFKMDLYVEIKKSA